MKSKEFLSLASEYQIFLDIQNNEEERKDELPKALHFLK
jgi:hypothetical protein